MRVIMRRSPRIIVAGRNPEPFQGVSNAGNRTAELLIPPGEIRNHSKEGNHHAGNRAA